MKYTCVTYWIIHHSQVQHCYKVAVQGGSNFWVCEWSVAIQIKTIEQHFPMVLFITLRKLLFYGLINTENVFQVLQNFIQEKWTTITNRKTNIDV